MSDRDLDTALVDAMRESQTNAQIVAERAAGLPVKVSSSFVVARTMPSSPGSRCFQRGDMIVKVNGSDLRTATALATMTTAKPAGTMFRLVVVRHGQHIDVQCRTFTYLGKARFGVTGSFQTEAYSLPVHVQYRLPRINGSSAGLMFALQIYRTITGRDISAGRDVAGTGVLAVDGSVQPIEGAREKIEAALRAHASIFLVPAKNYNDVRRISGIAVIRVQSFEEAVRALQSSQRRPVSALI
jgi:PDZ domain-containing protein